MVGADLQRQFDSGHVARVLQRLMHRDDPEVVALVVVNDAARQGDRAALAVDLVVGRGYMLIEGRGIGDQLEDRARLVDVADRVVAQQHRRSVAEVIGVEGGADGQSQNLAGMHVLDDHGAVVRMGALHGVVQRTLGQKLNVLVDGQHQVPARLRFPLAGAEHMTARVQGREHAAGNAMQLGFVLLLQAAQAVVVQPHVAQHLRGDFVARIEALRLLAEVDSFERAFFEEFLDAGRNRSTDAAGDPDEVLSGVQPGGDLLFGGLGVVGVGVDNRGQGVSRRLLVVNLAGNGEDRVHLHGHGQLVQVAVIEHAAARIHFEGPLLLLFGALDVLLVAHHLQPEEAKGDQNRPDQKKQADEPEARQLQGHGAWREVAVPAGSKICLHGGIAPGS